MLMPLERASLGLRIAISWPLIFTTPASGLTAPKIIFISVDLPAPFSPSTAWISPGITVSDTSLLATTPG